MLERVIFTFNVNGKYAEILRGANGIVSVLKNFPRKI